MGGDSTLLSSVKYEYTLRGDSAFGGLGVFPAMTKEITALYGADEKLSRVRTFDYDDQGNVTKYSVDGDLNAEIEYHNSETVRNAVSRIKVGDLRERSSEIDEKTGDIKKLIVSTGSSDAVYDMEYDKYGNITKITRPENDKKERTWTKLSYDDITHSLPIELIDSYGLKSQTEYDPLFNLPVKTTDVNGVEVSYTYDKKARLTSVLAPKEIGSGENYTLKFEYNLDNNEMFGTTYHNTPEGEFLIRSYIDSLARPKYIERASKLYTGNGIETKTVRSAYYVQDALGRKIREIKPSISGEDPETALTISFDALDRPLIVKQPSGAVTKYSYNVLSDEITGSTVLKTTVTDARGGVADKLTDGRGRTLATVRHHKSEDGDQLIVVKNKYDAMNQLIKVTHPNESESSYLYNKQGNVISYTSPDAGTVICEYTPQGQLLRRTDANGRVTEYGYDGVRLVSIKYPDMPSDSVTYIYGDSTATDNSRGRLIEVQDASGTEGYTYGIMGEVIKTERTINIDTLSQTVHSYEYEAEYDSWGRVRTMTYPDGEMVTYTYYNTGELHSVIGTTEDGAADKYLDRAGYDPYGRTIYRKLGNGTENFYTYDNNERLETSTLKNDGNIISTNIYRYDATDNIIGIRGISESAYNQAYTYDDLNRLISAGGMATEGKSDDGSEFNAYTMNMDYNLMSSPLNYELAIMNPTGTKLTNFDYLYASDVQPNAPIKVGDMTYTYDASGNPITIEGEEVSRSMTYDSENRLREIMDYRKNKNPKVRFKTFGFCYYKGSNY